MRAWKWKKSWFRSIEDKNRGSWSIYEKNVKGHHSKSGIIKCRFVREWSAPEWEGKPTPSPKVWRKINTVSIYNVFKLSAGRTPVEQGKRKRPHQMVEGVNAHHSGRKLWKPGSQNCLFSADEIWRVGWLCELKIVKSMHRGKESWQAAHGRR